MTLLVEVVHRDGSEVSEDLVTVKTPPRTTEALATLCKALLAPSQGGESPVSRLTLCIPAFVPLRSELALGSFAYAEFSAEKRDTLLFPRAAHARSEEEWMLEDDEDESCDDDEEDAAEAVAPQRPPTRADGKRLPNLHYCDISLKLQAVEGADGCVPELWRPEGDRVCDPPARCECLSPTVQPDSSPQLLRGLSAQPRRKA